MSLYNTKLISFGGLLGDLVLSETNSVFSYDIEN